MLNRRHLLATAPAAALLPLAGAHAQPAQSATPDAALNTLFDAFFREGLARNPERATQLGLDTGANAGLKHRLGDQSAAGIAAAKALNADQLRRLRAVDRGALSAAGKVNYDTVLYTRESTARLARFDFGGASFAQSPYAVSQFENRDTHLFRATREVA